MNSEMELLIRLRYYHQADEYERTQIYQGVNNYLLRLDYLSLFIPQHL